MNWDVVQAWGKYPLVFLVGMVVTSLLSLLWRQAAPRWGFVDVPGVRRIHAVPVPTAGGVALFAGFHAACAAIYILPWLPFSGQLSVYWWRDVAVVSAGVVVVGLLDDRLRLTPGAKLLGQLIVALLAYLQGLRIGNVFGAPLPAVVDVAATIGWFLVFMNAFNLIDGMDGLAAGLGVVAAAGVGVSLLFRHHPGDVLVCLALAGACIGFLRHNFHPARVFMGDTGSMFLGCAMASVALGTSSKGTAMASIGVPILAVGVPILDAGLAVWRRSVRTLLRPAGAPAEPLWGLATGDAEHLHHRLLRRGLSQRQVAVALYMFGAFLGGVGVVTSMYRESAMGAILVAFLVGVYVVVRHLAWIELWDSGSAMLRGLTRRGPQSRAVIIYPLLDVAALAVALAVALALTVGGGQGAGMVKREWVRVAPWAVGLPFVLLVASRSYSRVWSRARVSEYALTGGAVVGGILLWLGGALVFWQYAARQCITVALLYTGLAVPSVVGSRAFVRVLQDLMAWKSRLASGKAGRRVLLVGAGLECQLYLREAGLSQEAVRRATIVGLLDEDPGLWGRWVYGYRVLGGIDRLDAVIGPTGAEEVVIVDRLEARLVAQVVAVAQRRGLVVRQWKTAVQVLAPSP